MNSLYAQCVEVKDGLAANNHVTACARSKQLQKSAPEKLYEFKSKDSSDYIATINPATIAPSRGPGLSFW